MLNTIKFALKIAALCLLTLILGNMIHWRGKTLSDQVKSQLSHAESIEMMDQMKQLTGRVANDAQEGEAANPAPVYKVYKTKKAAETAAKEEIAPSERQKLRELIRDL